jgi:hypothetical protein
MHMVNYCLLKLRISGNWRWRACVWICSKVWESVI